jgi:hypothetical protein
MEPGAFGPELITAMTEAFEAARKTVHATRLSEAVPEGIVRRIIEATTFGERDAIVVTATRRRLNGCAASTNAHNWHQFFLLPCLTWREGGIEVCRKCRRFDLRAQLVGAR